MRIDAKQVPLTPDDLPPSGGKRGAAPASAPVQNEGAQVVSSSQVYANQAAACPDIRPDAVARAIQLLQSGQLDTPEAALRAAENISKLGL